MPNKDDYNLGYRPASYWNVPEAVYANIKGDFRRKQIREAREEGTLEDIPEIFLQDSLPELANGAVFRVHPYYASGECLPDYEPGEVEIARICLASVARNVISIRAIPSGDEICYRVVDEFGTMFSIPFILSPEPLTFAQLVDFMEDANGVGGYYDTHSSWQARCYPPELADRDDLLDVTSASSEFYPELERWYWEDSAEGYVEIFEILSESQVQRSES